MTPPDPASSPPPNRERLGAVTLRELTAGLAWPLLARSLGQSVRLVHLLIGVAGATIVFAGAWCLDWLWRTAVNGWMNQEEAASPFGPLGAIWPTGGRVALDDRFAAMGSGAASIGVLGWLVILVALIVLSICFGAIARSTALGLATGRTLGVPEAIRFALARGRSLSVALLVPAVLIGVLVGLIYLFRLVLMSADFLQPVGATLFVIPLVLGFAAAALVALLVAGHCMLAPAVVIENTDGVDAVQRSWGYLIARPIRFLFYIAVAGLILAVAYWVLQWVCRTAIDLSARALPDGSGDWEDGEPGYSWNAVSLWFQVLWLLFIGWVLSFYGSASAIVYLLMRLACDEQDLTVLWMPKAAPARVDEPVSEAAADLDL